MTNEVKKMKKNYLRKENYIADAFSEKKKNLFLLDITIILTVVPPSGGILLYYIHNSNLKVYLYSG